MTPTLATVSSLLCGSLLSGLTAQRLDPTPAASQTADDVYATRIEVKLAEGTGAILTDGGLRSRTGKDLSAVAKLFGQAKAERLIPLPLNTLDKWFDETRKGDGPRPDHLALWFRLRGKSAEHTTELLRDQPEVIAKVVAEHVDHDRLAGEVAHRDRGAVVLGHRPELADVGLDLPTDPGGLGHGGAGRGSEGGQIGHSAILRGLGAIQGLKNTCSILNKVLE